MLLKKNAGYKIKIVSKAKIQLGFIIAQFTVTWYCIQCLGPLLGQLLWYIPIKSLQLIWRLGTCRLFKITVTASHRILWYVTRVTFPGMGIPMLKIRRSRDRLIFNIGIPIPVKKHLYIETAPSYPSHRYLLVAQEDDVLTHCGLVMPHDNKVLGQHWLR